jgi:hypothetical protein
MADNCKLTLRLEGENRFIGGGIRVPETSCLTLEGDGNLKIELDGSDNYAIGNSLDRGHGKIEFYQDGEVNITSVGRHIIGIGSGLGGTTLINRGKYVIKMNGDEGVAVGSFKGDAPLIIHDCDFYSDTTFYKGVTIGNVEGNTNVDIFRSLVRLNGGGKRVSFIGSVDGDSSTLELHDLNLQVKASADYSTALGSLSGSTDLRIDTAGYTLESMGREALAYGGYSEDVRVIVYNVTVDINVKNDINRITNALQENVSIKFGSSNIVLNGKKIK